MAEYIEKMTIWLPVKDAANHVKMGLKAIASFVEIDFVFVTIH